MLFFATICLFSTFITEMPAMPKAILSNLFVVSINILCSIDRNFSGSLSKVDFEISIALYLPFISDVKPFLLL